MKKSASPETCPDDGRTPETGRTGDDRWLKHGRWQNSSFLIHLRPRALRSSSFSLRSWSSFFFSSSYVECHLFSRGFREQQECYGPLSFPRARPAPDSSTGADARTSSCSSLRHPSLRMSLFDDIESVLCVLETKRKEKDGGGGGQQ